MVPHFGLLADGMPEETAAHSSDWTMYCLRQRFRAVVYVFTKLKLQTMCVVLFHHWKFQTAENIFSVQLLKPNSYWYKTNPLTNSSEGKLSTHKM